MSKAKAKGTATENYIRDKHIEAGVNAERVPGSGMFGGKYTGDICIPSVEHCVFRCESKARKGGAGFKTLEKWMGTDHIMFLKRNYQMPLVVLTWDTYLTLMKAYWLNDKYHKNTGQD